LCGELGGMGYEALCSYEPYYEEYRSLIGRLGEDRYSVYAEALLFAADRVLHYARVVGPALRRGAVVVLDRYYHSSIAYQGARGAPPDWVRSLNRFAPPPDLAIYLDVDPETGLRRKLGDSWDKERFQRAELLGRVREIYLGLVEEGELLLVDASRSLGEVYGDVLSLVLGFLAGRRGG
ncbi:MAG: dTMP kinase, partial [Candidatus Korarchaeota archaeon]|nr:dTMP kinase [Candidatus Korarchaeota archaeon]